MVILSQHFSQQDNGKYENRKKRNRPPAADRVDLLTGEQSARMENGRRRKRETVPNTASLHRNNY